MKRNTGKYKEVKTLPKNARTVRQYCEDEGVTQPFVYTRYRRGKNDTFDIVIFQGVNFIVPIERPKMQP